MKASTLFTNNDDSLSTTSKPYLFPIKKWVFNTPERALNQAYNAALRIQAIEDEYFQGYKISINSDDYSDYLMSFVRTDFQRELIISKLRLLEFKTSCLVLSIPVSAHLEKLSFLDGVLAKYVSQEYTSVALTPLIPSEKIDSSSEKNQLPSATVSVVDVKKTSEQKTSLPKVIGKAKTEKEAKAKADASQNLRNSSINIKTAITGAAIKYTVLLVVLPLLYQQVSKQFFQPASTATLQQELEHRSHKSK